MPDPYFEKLIANAAERQQASLSADRKQQELAASAVEARQTTRRIAATLARKLVAKGVDYDCDVKQVDFIRGRWPNRSTRREVSPLVEGWRVHYFGGSRSTEESDQAPARITLLTQEARLVVAQGWLNPDVSTVQQPALVGPVVQPNIMAGQLGAEYYRIQEEQQMHQNLANLAFKYGITDL